LRSRRALQAAIAAAGLVPVIAGAAGAARPSLIALGTDPHAAYLSGLLLGIGLAFWSLIPTIERQSRSFALLSAIVILGGVARLFLAVRLGDWRPAVTLPLTMELGIVPLLWLWQRRVARSFLLPRE
jgi:hypothetical protein